MARSKSKKNNDASIAIVILFTLFVIITALAVYLFDYFWIAFLVTELWTSYISEIENFWWWLAIFSTTVLIWAMILHMYIFPRLTTRSLKIYKVLRYLCVPFIVSLFYLNLLEEKSFTIFCVIVVAMFIIEILVMFYLPSVGVQRELNKRDVFYVDLEEADFEPHNLYN